MFNGVRFLAVALGLGAALSCAGDDETFVSPNSDAASLLVRDEKGFQSLRERMPVADDLVVLRLGAAWCGPCQWHIKNDASLLSEAAQKRVRFVDIVLRGAENALPQLADLDTIRALRGDGGAVYADPSLAVYEHASKIAGAHSIPLPSYVILDGRDLHTRGVVVSSEAVYLSYKLRSELQDVTGQKFADVSPEVSASGFDPDVWALLQGMARTDARRLDPSNAFADNQEAANIGAELFSNAALSPSGKVSCQSCHDPSHGFSDPRAVSVEAGVGTRNAPSLLTMARRHSFFWDGRADALWTQALGPFENDAEYASARGLVVKRVLSRYGARWSTLFGEQPWQSSELAQIADDARPGRASWTRLPAALRERVNASFVNVGKAIAAFERTLQSKDTRFDAYVRGDRTALTAVERDGLARFLVNGCAQCHWGPDLTDDAYHVIRFASGRQDGRPDTGRSGGIAALQHAEFSANGPWADTRNQSTMPRPEAHLRGAFKTPSLRAIADTAPYGHGGNLATLEDMLALYQVPGLPDTDARATGVTEHWVVHFHESDIPSMAAFLRVLTDKTPNALARD